MLKVGFSSDDWRGIHITPEVRKAYNNRSSEKRGKCEVVNLKSRAVSLAYFDEIIFYGEPAKMMGSKTPKGSMKGSITNKDLQERSRNPCKPLFLLVAPMRFERMAYRLGVSKFTPFRPFHVSPILTINDSLST